MGLEATPGEAGRAFVLKLGRLLHAYGYPSHRLESALEAVSRRLGLEAQFFSMPTALFASFGAGDEQRTFQIRIEPGEVDLRRLALLDRVTAEVARGELAPAAGSTRLDAIVAAPPLFGRLATTLSFALASGAASRFFGGGVREVVAAAAIGLVLGLLALAADHFRGLGRIFDPLAATTAAFLATLVAATSGPVSAYIVTLAGLILLVPGLSLTTAMTELAMRHLMSGTARFAGTCVTFLAIGFGVALGTHLGRHVAGAPPIVEPTPLPGWTEWAALVLAPLAFTVLLKAEPRDAPFIVVAAALAFGGARVGARTLGPELGAFAGALLVGLGSSAYSRLLGRPAAVTLVPGILLLVPGSIGFRSLSSLLQRDTIVGVESAFLMTLVAISIVTGLLFASALLPERELDAAAGSPLR